MERTVGIDLGGTAIKAGAVSRAGAILDRREMPVPKARGGDAVLDALAEVARSLDAGSEGLGLASAGMLDRERGLMVECPNIKAIENVPLRDGLAERLGLPSSAVVLENDANAAAVGEAWLGVARGEPDVLVLTLGTGIGSGLLLDGRLFIGPGGMAAEIGHAMFDPDGLPCGCGSRGCFETVASATAAARRARERGLIGDEPDALVALTERARAGPGPERDLLEDVGRDLGRGISIAVTFLDLRLFVVAGGFSAALPEMMPGIRAGLRERIHGRRVDEVRVVRATLGADAGWIGAARLVAP